MDTKQPWRAPVMLEFRVGLQGEENVMGNYVQCSKKLCNKS